MIGTVHVVEWLDPGEPRTGQDLVDLLQPLGVKSKPRVQVRYWHAVTRDDFFNVLSKIKDECEATRSTPLLQIETHGNVDGIGIEGQPPITWQEFAEALIPLNSLTGLNLVIFLAACQGFWGVKMLRPGGGRRAPFRGLIAPHEEIYPNVQLKGCMAFYSTVFAQLDGNAALKAMNDTIDPDQETFWEMSAERAFKIVYRGYRENLSRPEEFEHRVNTLAASRAAERRAKGLESDNNEETQKDREIPREFLSDRGRFEKMRRDFFFIDLYPENAQRFDVTFEDCEPQKSGR